MIYTVQLYQVMGLQIVGSTIVLTYQPFLFCLYYRGVKGYYLFYDDGFDDIDDGDDWSDEEDDDLPPDFDEDAELLEMGQGKTIKQDSRQNDEMVLLPVLPDGRPREQW